MRGGGEGGGESVGVMKRRCGPGMILVCVVGDKHRSLCPYDMTHWF